MKDSTSSVDIQRFKDYLQKDLQGMAIIEHIAELRHTGASKAGKGQEGIFASEFLCPCIRRFFYEEVRGELNLSPEEIAKGLLVEGYEGCTGFGFTPASKRKHLFTKSQVVKSSAPTAWRRATAKLLANFHACPDFAICSPLPFSVVGEVKYFALDSAESAIRELYNAARQATFYLSAFHKQYESAMIVVADGSPGHSFFKGLEMLRPELLERFGEETDIHLVAIRLR